MACQDNDKFARIVLTMNPLVAKNLYAHFWNIRIVSRIATIHQTLWYIISCEGSVVEI